MGTEEPIIIEYTDFVTINLGNKGVCSTFGYFWLNKDKKQYEESNNDNCNHHLYIGKPGKETCMHFVYNVKERLLFKSSVCFFNCYKDKNINRSEGVYYSMMFCAMYIIIKDYPDCKFLFILDDANTVINVHDKNYYVNCSNINTILYGNPRLHNFIQTDAIALDVVNTINELKINKNELNKRNKKKMPFDKFYNTFYRKYNEYNKCINNEYNKCINNEYNKCINNDNQLFTKKELCKLKSIYDSTDSLTTFFKLSEEYLQKNNKSKWLFIPLKEILEYYHILHFTNETIVIDIHIAIRNLKEKNFLFTTSYVENEKMKNQKLKHVSPPSINDTQPFYKIHHHDHKCLLEYNLAFYKKQLQL